MAVAGPGPGAPTCSTTPWIKQTRHDASVLARHLVTAVQRAITSPEEEQRNDVWDLGVLGLGGSFSFTAISQEWLRQSANWRAAEDIPRHRGRQARHTAKGVVAVLGDRWGQPAQIPGGSLRQPPRATSRRDIVAFTNRLAHQQRTGQISEKTRLEGCRAPRRFLADIRAMGLTRPGERSPGCPTTSP